MKPQMALVQLYLKSRKMQKVATVTVATKMSALMSEPASFALAVSSTW